MRTRDDVARQADELKRKRARNMAWSSRAAGLDIDRRATEELRDSMTPQSQDPEAVRFRRAQRQTRQRPALLTLDERPCGQLAMQELRQTGLVHDA